MPVNKVTVCNCDFLADSEIIEFLEAWEAAKKLLRQAVVGRVTKRRYKNGRSQHPSKQRILNILLSHPGIVESSVIIDYVWGDDPEGGPEQAPHTLKTHVFYINKALRLVHSPFRIGIAHGHGHFIGRLHPAYAKLPSDQTAESSYPGRRYVSELSLTSLYYPEGLPSPSHPS